MPFTFPNEGQWIRCPDGTGRVKKATFTDPGIPADVASCCEPKCPRVGFLVFQKAPQYPCGFSGFSGCFSGDCNFTFVVFNAPGGEGSTLHVSISPFSQGPSCHGLLPAIFDYEVSDGLGPTWTLVYGPDSNNVVAYAATTFKCPLGSVTVLPALLEWQDPREPCGSRNTALCGNPPLPDPHGNGCGEFCAQI